MRFPRINAGRAVQWLSLAAGAAWLLYWSVLPRLHAPHARGYVDHAFFTTLMLWGWSALIGWLLLHVARVEGPNRPSLRTSVGVVWFAPAVILASRLTLASVIPAIALAAVTARLLFIE